MGYPLLSFSLLLLLLLLLCVKRVVTENTKVWWRGFVVLQIGMCARFLSVPFCIWCGCYEAAENNEVGCQSSSTACDSALVSTKTFLCFFFFFFRTLLFSFVFSLLLANSVREVL